MDNLKIIVLGEDSFTGIVLESILKKNYQVLKVFTPSYNNNIHKRLQLICENNNIDFQIVEDVKSTYFSNQIRSLNPDLIVICHFQKLISNEIIDIPRLGCLNLHPSLLPEYRGMSPQHWPIINGDKFTGITVHFVDDGVDTGNIVLQEKVEILANDSVWDLQNRMKDVYGKIYVEAIAKIGNTQSHLKQKDLPGSYYGRLKIIDCQIDLGMSTIEMHNLIRGVSFPYFGARFKDYIIWKSEILNNYPNTNIRFEINNQKQAIFYLEDGALLINKYQKNEKSNC